MYFYRWMDCCRSATFQICTYKLLLHFSPPSKVMEQLFNPRLLKKYEKIHENKFRRTRYTISLNFCQVLLISPRPLMKYWNRVSSKNYLALYLHPNWVYGSKDACPINAFIWFPNNPTNIPQVSKLPFRFFFSILILNFLSVTSATFSTMLKSCKLTANF